MASKRKMKSQTVTPERVAIAIRSRFDPIPHLTPARLPLMHEAFERGYLGQAVRVWEAIATRHYQCKCVIPKREKSLRHGFDYVYTEGMEKDKNAQRHMKALKYFYENLRCVNAADQNQRGGAPLLVRTMMKAHGMRYAVHEMVWDVRGPEQLTATFWSCPLYFFENTTGRLRYLQREGDLNGIPLQEGQWLVTVGEGLMFATAIAYMYGTLPLRDLLNYCERYAIPGAHGKTDAEPNSPEWKAMEQGLRSLVTDLVILTSRGSEIEKIDLSATGEIPHPKLVEMMDRAISLIWRGGDLSTLSRGQDAVGANLQEDEVALLEQDDAQIITDTLNEQVDRWVIRFLFDEDPLCWVKVRTAQRKDVKQDIEVDRFLGERGFPETVENLASRYGRTLPDEGQKVLPPLSPAPSPYATPFPRLANAEPERPEDMRDLVSAGITEIARAQSDRMKPVADELLRLYRRAELEDFTDEMLATELRSLQDRLPDLLREMADDEATAESYANLMAAAWANGMAEGVTA